MWRKVVEMNFSVMFGRKTFIDAHAAFFSHFSHPRTKKDCRKIDNFSFRVNDFKEG